MSFPFGIDLQLANKKGPILTTRGLDITCTQEHIVEVIIFFRSVEQKRRAGGASMKLCQFLFFLAQLYYTLFFVVIKLLFLSNNNILLVPTGTYNDMIKSNGMYINRAVVF